MKLTHVVNVLFVHWFSLHSSVHGQVTFLEKYRPEYRNFRAKLFNFIGRTDGDWSYNWNYKKGVK